MPPLLLLPIGPLNQLTWSKQANWHTTHTHTPVLGHKSVTLARCIIARVFFGGAGTIYCGIRLEFPPIECECELFVCHLIYGNRVAPIQLEYWNKSNQNETETIGS